ncbi:hypothetical protein [Photobacterium sp. R1]
MNLIASFLVVLFFCFTDSTYADELDFSQYDGQEYDLVKNDLLTKGWTYLPTQEDEVSMNEQYPEITCGLGSMAICSVGFRNSNHTVAFVIKKSGNKIIIAGQY